LAALAVQKYISGFAQDFSFFFFKIQLFIAKYHQKFVIPEQCQ